MKKTILLGLSIALALLLVACGQGSTGIENTASSDASVTEAVSDSTINDSLDGIVKDLDESFEDYIQVASNIEKAMSWVSSQKTISQKEIEEALNACIDRQKYDELKNSRMSYYDTVLLYARDIWQYRNAIDTKYSNILSRIKGITPTNGTQDYYDAVKEYYKAVTELRTLAVEFPNGYSVKTYHEAIMGYKENCEKAQNEFLFY